MARYTPEQFGDWFAEVVAPEDKLIVVYSGIWSFGHRFGIGGKELPVMLIQQMLAAIGPQRTLVMPSYTPSFARTRVYNPHTSPAETGILPQVCLTEFGGVRTSSALDSFVAIGPQAEALAAMPQPKSLWGEGSLLELFEREHARMVMLGISWGSLGLLHRIEEVGKIPYRYFKNFHGHWVGADDVTKPWQETMLVRSLYVPPVYNWNVVGQLLRERGLTRRSNSEVAIESVDGADVIAAGLDLIAKDPYALLFNADEVKQWVKQGMVSELAELRQREPLALAFHDQKMARAAGSATH
jgi:aminoglycoside 3-N-acetyltransferase